MSEVSELIKTVDQYYWFHSIDLGNGVVTKGIKSPDVLRFESAAFFDPINLKDRSVIDIGAWNGAYSVEAKRRGAGRVLATDHYVWNKPDYGRREPFDLIVSTLGLDIEALDIDVPELVPERVGTFDAVLFLGVFYHLFDPIDGLMRAARLAKEVLVVESHVDLHEIKRPAMAYYPGAELSNDPTSWWGPNPLCLYLLLKQLGFEQVDVRYGMGQARAIFHAWRSNKFRRSGPPSDPSLEADLGLTAAPSLAAAPSLLQTPPVSELSRCQKLRAGLRLIVEGLRPHKAAR
jgi:tRNA (mo5U34)-methyltransferase